MDLKQELIDRLGVPENWDKYDYQTQRYSFDDIEEVLEDIVKKLLIHSVSESLSTIIEINFDGHLKCQIETTDKAPTILKAVNGYGQPVDCNKDKTIVNEI